MEALNSTEQEQQNLEFLIASEDVLIANDDGGFTVNNYHKRIFVARNLGNMALHVEALTVSDRGCNAYGFRVENCQPFSL